MTERIMRIFEILKGLLEKGRMKGIKVVFSKELNQSEIHGV